jgi:transketolase
VIIYVDMNGFQCDRKMCNVMDIEPLDKRLESFGVHGYFGSARYQALAEVGSPA